MNRHSESPLCIHGTRSPTIRLQFPTSLNLPEKLALYLVSLESPFPTLQTGLECPRFVQLIQQCPADPDFLPLASWPDTSLVAILMNRNLSG